MGVETQLASVQLIMKVLILLAACLPVVVPGAAQENRFSLFDPFELVNRIDPHKGAFQKSAFVNTPAFDPFKSFAEVTTTRKPRRRMKTSRPRPATPKSTTQTPTTTQATTSPTTTVAPTTTSDTEATTSVQIQTTDIPVEINEVVVKAKKTKKSQLNPSDRDWIKSIQRPTTRTPATTQQPIKPKQFQSRPQQFAPQQFAPQQREQ